MNSTAVPEIKGPTGVAEGTLIAGKYRIEALIAHGGMGVLYQAWQPLLARNVAIKLVRPELMTRSDAPARFLREARVLAQLQTEHVCKVLDVGALPDGAPYMVLEYLEGDDLRNILNASGRFEVKRAVDLVLQVAEALAEAHAMGVVHRDVKPENLFLLRDASGAETVKLLDFGICQTEANAARYRGSQQADEFGLGSPHYMAPEQISAPHAFDARLDVWSLGVVLYELLCGEPPFDGDDVTSICAQVLGREPQSLRLRCPDLPPGIEQVVERCLAKSADERYPELGELAVALAPYGTRAAEISSQRVCRTLSLDRSLRAAPLAPSIDEMTIEEKTEPKLPRAPTASEPVAADNVVSLSKTRRRALGAKQVSAVLVAGAVLGSVAGPAVVSEARARELAHRTVEGVQRTIQQTSPIVRAAVTAVGVGLDGAIDHAIRVYSSPPANQDGDSSWLGGEDDAIDGISSLDSHSSER